MFLHNDIGKNLKNQENCDVTSLKRILSLVLALALAAGVLCMPAVAADTATEHPYLEKWNAPWNSALPFGWTETSVEITSGTNTLFAIVTQPIRVKDTIPVAVLTHGLSTNAIWCNDIAWALAEEGIASIRFDFAGTGLSSGRMEDMTISTEVADTIAVLDFVRRLPYCDDENILLAGKSMGAVDGLLAAQQWDGEIRAMCLFYPGFAIKDTVRHGFLLGSFFDPRNPPETLDAAWYTYGRGFLEEAAAVDYESACADYDNPVLIIHGDRDFIAPIHFSMQMTHVFEDCTLQVVPGGFHGFFDWQEKKALEDMVSFFQENMA